MTADYMRPLTVSRGLVGKLFLDPSKALSWIGPK